MNYDVERSSNVLIDETPSANVLAGSASGRTQRAFHRDKEERVHSRQKRRADEWRKNSNSLTKRLLGGLLSIMHGVTDEGRIIVQGLRPPSIPFTRLEHAFFEILEEIARDARPPFRIVVTGQPKTLSSAIEEQVYRIQREALINAIRHSDAASIEAEVEYFPRRLRVVIRDNGCGFEPKVLKLGRSPHCGIRTMVEQAKAMGAQLQIWTRPGSGTEVELSLPFDPRSMPVHP
jgi:signal transduction histidine kinase